MQMVVWTLAVVIIEGAWTQSFKTRSCANWWNFCQWQCSLVGHIHVVLAVTKYTGASHAWAHQQGWRQLIMSGTAN